MSKNYYVYTVLLYVCIQLVDRLSFISSAFIVSICVIISTALLEQIGTLKKTSESKLESMKTEIVIVEAELEEARYTASLAGVTPNKEYKKQLADKQQKLRQIKEKTEAAEQLQQKVVAGLAHISNVVCRPKIDDDAPVSDLHKNIEAVLDTLINEREKQLQQQQQGQTQSSSVENQAKATNIRDSNSAVSTYIDDYNDHCM